MNEQSRMLRTFVQQPDKDTCGPAALAMAMSADYPVNPELFDRLCRELRVYTGLITGVMPWTMVSAAARRYQELVPLDEAGPQDLGVALNSGLYHWVAWQMGTDVVMVADPFTGDAYSLEPEEFLDKFTFGFAVRCPGRGEVDTDTYRSLMGQFSPIKIISAWLGF